VTLSWQPSSSAVVGYFVYRGAVSGGPYARISPGLVAALDYHDAAVSDGALYFYVVTAVDAAGMESVFSNETTASIP